MALSTHHAESSLVEDSIVFDPEDDALGGSDGINIPVYLSRSELDLIIFAVDPSGVSATLVRTDFAA